MQGWRNLAGAEDRGWGSSQEACLPAPLRSRQLRARACELITRSPFITHEKVSGALWTQGLCSSQGRQDFFFFCHHLGCKDAKEIRICSWKEPLSLRSELPKPQRMPFGQAAKGQAKLKACPQHLRNTQRGGPCKQSSQPSWVQTRQLSGSWHPCAGLELNCSSLFSSRKRERK